MSGKRQVMAREMAARAARCGEPQGFLAFQSDVREYARFLVHELELLGVAPVRVEVVLANGARVRVQALDAEPIDVAAEAARLRLERLRLSALARGRDMLEHCYHAGRAKELDDAAIALAATEIKTEVSA